MTIGSIRGLPKVTEDPFSDPPPATADDSAVAVVPAARAEEILAECRRMESAEQQFEKSLREGKTFAEATKMWGRV